ncbi:MAG: hypothetical protein PHS16_03205 [Candidatus Colwellbacteria bacterium]|nr:hypothetical protein [Candidatus Paceibacterota bacterium]MDD3752912.1 hypothetical protein [Candidatus Colwellbacteria bacterium]MDD4201201.1 hypothetical protein [Candidatus Paceibacterota bacterium]
MKENNKKISRLFLVMFMAIISFFHLSDLFEKQTKKNEETIPVVYRNKKRQIIWKNPSKTIFLKSANNLLSLKTEHGATVSGIVYSEILGIDFHFPDQVQFQKIKDEESVYFVYFENK